MDKSRTNLTINQAITEGLIIKREMICCNACPCYNSDECEGSRCGLKYSLEFHTTTTLKNCVTTSQDCRLLDITYWNKRGNLKVHQPKTVLIYLRTDKHDFSKWDFVGAWRKEGSIILKGGGNDGEVMPDFQLDMDYLSSHVDGVEYNYSDSKKTEKRGRYQLRIFKLDSQYKLSEDGCSCHIRGGVCFNCNYVH